MLSTFYFPYVAMLASTSIPSLLGEVLSEGQVPHALSLTSKLVDTSEPEHVPMLLRLRGDLQLSIGLDVDADDSFREAQKMMLASKEQVRFLSCRNAGWQALFRQRYGTAMSCFTRLVEQPHGDLSLRLEGMFGTFCVLFSVCCLREAYEALDSLEALLDTGCVDVANTSADQIIGGSRFCDAGAGYITVDRADGWRQLVNAVRFDLFIQSELRTQEALSDHVYWQSGLSGEEGLPTVGGNASHAQAVTAAFLHHRIRYLKRLMHMANGDRDAAHELTQHAEWAAKRGMSAYQGAVRTEIVLASLAVGCATLAETLLSVLGAERLPQGLQQLEYLYALFKLRHQQGRSGESQKLYKRYALGSMRCIRNEASTLLRYAQRSLKPPAQLDDISARLPARYRRAYVYLQDNLERKDLSVQEIAAVIGVTARALQSAFKTSLGSTPSEIVRQLRMQRIRTELEAKDSMHENDILGTANRWGVSNRSTLLNGYRREFNEAPSDTVNR